MLTLVSCKYHRYYIKEDFNPQDINLLLVFPFENLTAHANAGEIVTEIFISELRRDNKFTILAGPQLDIKLLAYQKKIQKQHKNDSFKLEQNSISEMGLLSNEMTAYSFKIARVLKADAVIFGKITEFRYKKGLGEEPVIGITIQMISSKLETLWNSSISITQRRFSLSESSLCKLAQIACKKMVKVVPAPKRRKGDKR